MLPLLESPPRPRSNARRRVPSSSASSLPPVLQSLVARTLAAMAPPSTMTVSEWADAWRMLSPEASAEPGLWDTGRAEYLRGVMDAISEPGVSKVVVAKGSQVGFTECLNNILGFYIDQDPAPILIVQPNVEMAEAWSKDRFSPMIRDTPCLTNKVHSPMSRDSGNTLRQKVFAGGRLAIVGANSPAGLASRPIRIVIADEVDRFPVSAGSEGDPLALASKRQQTFWNRKTLLGSTPTLKETSVIWREWLASDQRRFFVPCHACGHAQALTWTNVKWDETPEGQHLPTTAYYTCEACGSIWNDADRRDAVTKGEWIATNPAVVGIAGFHIPGLLSPWLMLADIVAEFLAARKDAALLQVWSNTVLGEPTEPKQEFIEGSGLLRRGEVYGPGSIPDEALLLTAGVDVQGDRLEVQVIAFGAHEETWAVRYEVLPGDPAQAHVWTLLDHVLADTYHTDGGRELRIRATCIDTGGHHQHHVLTYCQTRRRRNVLPIKGAAGPRPIWPPRASRTKTNANIWIVGVDTAKDTIYSRLRIPNSGPGFMHFPIGGAFDAEYFSQLTAEVVRTRYQHGRPYRVWTLPNGKRNEALDTAAYALAARHATRIQILHPRPETKLSARPSEDDDNEMIPPAHPAGEAEGGPEIGLGTQPRRDSDPNMMYQPSRQQPQQGGSWIYRGERPPGNWINRGRL
jgi:phage terminase large subunit GpA-like protein